MFLFTNSFFRLVSQKLNDVHSLLESNWTHIAVPIYWMNLSRVFSPMSHRLALLTRIVKFYRAVATARYEMVLVLFAPSAVIKSIPRIPATNFTNSIANIQHDLLPCAHESEILWGCNSKFVLLIRRPFHLEIQPIVVSPTIDRTNELRVRRCK